MKRLKSWASVLTVALSMVLTSGAFAQVTPYDEDVATAAGYFTDKFYLAVPVILGLCAGVYMLWWAWHSLKKSTAMRRGV